MVGPFDLIRRMYNVPAFRASRRGTQARGKWWASTPEEADAYINMSGTELYYEGSAMIPGQLNTEGMPVIEARGANWNAVPGTYITDPKLRGGLETQGYSQDILDDLKFNLDEIAVAAEQAGYPGVVFKDVYDQSGTPHTQYYIADPSRRRSRFAKFQDPFSDDLMASMLMSIMGGGTIGGAALSQDRRQT